jgi:hypothetical protein
LLQRDLANMLDLYSLDLLKNIYVAYSSHTKELPADEEDETERRQIQQDGEAAHLATKKKNMTQFKTICSKITTSFVLFNSSYMNNKSSYLIFYSLAIIKRKIIRTDIREPSKLIHIKL